jgi:polyhydroxybutyrate depolymerase
MQYHSNSLFFLIFLSSQLPIFPLYHWPPEARYQMVDVNFKKFYLDVEGILRYYYLYVPPDLGDRVGVPLVILLHGAGGNPRTVRNLTGMNELAEQEKFIVAYPQGTGVRDRQLTWNAGQCCGFAYENDIDDVAFIRELTAELSSQQDIDEHRVYAAGISNGGMMTQRLACELSDRIAAAAVVAASIPKITCKPKEPLSVIMFNGTADLHVPYEGGKAKKSVLDEPIVHASVKDAVSFWVTHNGCHPQPELKGDDIVKKETYSGGKNNTQVILYTIAGGGHTWPGTKVRKPDPQDPMQRIAATPLIWEFFNKNYK